MRHREGTAARDGFAHQLRQIVFSGPLLRRGVREHLLQGLDGGVLGVLTHKRFNAGVGLGELLLPEKRVCDAAAHGQIVGGDVKHRLSLCTSRTPPAGAEVAIGQGLAQAAVQHRVACGPLCHKAVQGLRVSTDCRSILLLGLEGVGSFRQCLRGHCLLPLCGIAALALGRKLELLRAAEAHDALGVVAAQQRQLVAGLREVRLQQCQLRAGREQLLRRRLVLHRMEQEEARAVPLAVLHEQVDAFQEEPGQLDRGHKKGPAAVDEVATHHHLLQRYGL
mmetsp:Transcript_97470/g.163861  ORF Transcript_97470/g.163861 Transcript_97470/m.163861 type:complete len:279 (-) Transcript_97470:1331-2167(-)